MTTLFETTWKECEYYLDNGISVIPVRDKPQTWNGREYPIKSAYPWKKWQNEIISKAELLYLMTEKYDTIGYGIVAGKVSGNLEIIDVDVKNWQGIDAMLFQDIKALYPDIFNRLRITQTPSKGYHIFYRISDHEPAGNLKFAWKEDAKEAAIESRGEGGYVVAASQMSYKVVKDNPIPTITWNERCSIIAICEGYNQKKKIAAITPTTTSNDYYDQNPFEHFNGSAAAERVLTDNGWTLCGSNNNFIWFTRPGKNTGVSASWNRTKRCYFIFTSSTDLDPSKGYNPVTLLSILQHGSDRKKTYKWLCDNGYGVIKEKKQKQLAQNAARKGYNLPANVSAETKQLAVSIQGELLELHPHGTFWDYDTEDGKVIINREKLMLVANYLGFRYYKGNVVRIIDYLIYKIEEREFQDVLKDYIREPDNEECIKILNAIESFLESHGKYTMKRLPILTEDLILKDTETTCFKFFLNGYLIIDRTHITFAEYDALEMLIWAERLQQRNYNKGEGGKYVEFLKLAIGEEHLQHVKSVLGFLSHEYKDETTGYIIVLTEQCRNPKDGGGSGKNVFCSLLKSTTTYTSKPGAQTKFDEKFFQSWNGQKIFCISDVPKNFDFAFLKEPSTGSFIWKKLFKDEVEVSNEEAPKFIVQTNFSYEVSDGGLRRRIIPIEFTDFFTKVGGLDVHFGCHFPKGWTKDDWAGFDDFIAKSVQTWLLTNKKLKAPELTNGGWLKQFEQTYGSVVFNFIEQNFNHWCERVEITNDTFKSYLESYYLENNIPKQYHPSTQRINAAIREYAIKNNIEFESDMQKRNNGVVVKYRNFFVKVPF